MMCALVTGVQTCALPIYIVVLGHSACGGIRALRAAASGAPSEREFMVPWMAIAAGACRCDAGSVPDQRAVEHAGVRTSLRNLRTFPWIEERAQGRQTVRERGVKYAQV